VPRQRVRREPGAIILDASRREFPNPSKSELQDLADKLVFNDLDAIVRCIEFICAETRGNWHGRARAMMCRHLKHCPVNPEQRERIVTCITGRLGEGNFSEQFYDQLRLALCFDRQATFAAARKSLSESPKAYVRRYSSWVLEHDSSRDPEGRDY
jgi:hypothetical protein